MKTEHYRITIDVTTEFDGGNRCGDIEHNLYMIEKELLPYTVKTKKVEYNVEKLTHLTDLDMDNLEKEQRNEIPTEH